MKARLPYTRGPGVPGPCKCSANIVRSCYLRGRIFFSPPHTVYKKHGRCTPCGKTPRRCRKTEPPRPPARCAGSEEDLVLWAQILLCLAAIGLVLAAGALDWPVYPELRRAFTAAMQPEQSLLLGEERNLLKFTEQTAGELVDSARSMWEDFTLPATPESARTAHGQPSPPAYARTDSYTPGFPLQFPLPGQSRKTSGYGWRTDPMGGLGDDFHIGNDLAAAQGTPVLAAADGVVRMAGSHKSYGNYLRILHADGDETLYAHMQYLFVKAGECVTAGQILGTVGETGNATGPHLHFEILHRGLRYDPARPCRMRRSRARSAGSSRCLPLRP